MNTNDKKTIKDNSAKKTFDFKWAMLMTLIIGILGLMYSVWESFHLLHHGDKLNQAGIDDLIHAERIMTLLAAPAFSMYLILLSVVMWRYFKISNSDSGQSGKNDCNQ